MANLSSIYKKNKEINQPTNALDGNLITQIFVSMIPKVNSFAINSKIFAKDTMNMPMMARDTNIMRQNIAKLVKLQGGSASTKADSFFEKSKDRERLYESAFSKENKGYSEVSTSGQVSPLGQKAINFGAVSLGIVGFFGALALAGKLVNSIPGGIDGMKNMFFALAEGLGAFDVRSLAAFSALLVGGAIFGSYASAGSLIKAPIGIAAVGLGIGGFLSGLAAGGFLGTFLGNSAGVRDMLINLAEGLSAFNTQSLVTFGVLLTTGAIFGSWRGPVEAGQAAIGMTAIGLGLGGFLSGLATGGAAVNALGGSKGVRDIMVSLAEGLNAFNTQSLIAFGALLANGAIFGESSTGQGIGIAIMGAAFGAFLGALSVSGWVVKLLDSPGEIKNLLTNFAQGLNALTELDGKKLREIIPVIPDMGIALGKFVGATGLGGLVKAIGEGLTKVVNFIFGEKNSKTPIEKLIDDLNLLSSVETEKVISGSKNLLEALNIVGNFSDQTILGATQRINNILFVLTRLRQLPTPSTTAPGAPSGANVQEHVFTGPMGALGAPRGANIQEHVFTGPMGPMRVPPSAPAPADSTNTLRERIAQGESGGKYDIVYGSGNMVNGKLVTENTIKEIADWQDTMRASNRNAAGRYQFMDVRYIAAKAGIPLTAKFDQKNQDLMYEWFSKTNAKVLRNLGIEVTPFTIMASHSVGPAGYAFLFKSSSGPNDNAAKRLFEDPNSPSYTKDKELRDKRISTNPHLNRPISDVFAMWAVKSDHQPPSSWMARYGQEYNISLAKEEEKERKKLAYLAGRRNKQTGASVASARPGGQSSPTSTSTPSMSVSSLSSGAGEQIASSSSVIAQLKFEMNAIPPTVVVNADKEREKRNENQGLRIASTIDFDFNDAMFGTVEA